MGAGHLRNTSDTHPKQPTISCRSTGRRSDTDRSVWPELAGIFDRYNCKMPYAKIPISVTDIRDCCHKKIKIFEKSRCDL